MRRRRQGSQVRRRLLWGLTLLFAGGCPHHPIMRPYPAPPPVDVVAHLTSRPQDAPALKAETRTDVRVGKDRVNVSVYIRAAWGGKLRFQAMNPNDSLAADLASDGAGFCFLDSRANCGACGPATPENVARLIRIPLQPDEVVAVMLGSAPLLPDDAPEVAWDDRNGREILTLDNAGWKQRLVLDGKNRRWDVLSAELHDPEGKLAWRVQHKDFHDVAAPGGKTLRLPGVSLFEQGKDKVKIDWREQAIEEAPADDKFFHLELQPGLATCGDPPQP